MIKEFLDWLIHDAVDSIVSVIWGALEVAWWSFVGVITSPVWIIPFLYWYFTKWRGKDNAKEE